MRNRDTDNISAVRCLVAVARVLNGSSISWRTMLLGKVEHNM